MQRFNPFGMLLGLKCERTGPGLSNCTLDVRPDLMNPNGVLHGGVVYSLADTGMGAALHTQLSTGERCATIEINIVYLSPVTEGSLQCTSRVVHRGRSTAVIESDVFNSEQLVARALGTFSIVQK